MSLDMPTINNGIVNVSALSGKSDLHVFIIPSQVILKLNRTVILACF